MVRRTVPADAVRRARTSAGVAGVHQMDYLTNFERRFREEGRPIHRMRFDKPSSRQCSVSVQLKPSTGSLTTR